MPARVSGDEPFLPNWAVSTNLGVAVADTTSTFVEVADASLFGLPGVGLSGVRFFGSTAKWVGQVSASRLTTSAGAESRFSVGGGPHGARFRSLATIAYTSLEVPEAPSAGVIALGFSQQTRINDAWRISVEIDGFVVSGTSAPGANIAAVADTRLTPQATVALGVELHRVYGAGVLASALFAPVPQFEIVFGYDGLATTPGVVVTVVVKALRVSSAFRVHPVLGNSHGVSLLWVR